MALCECGCGHPVTVAYEIKDRGYTTPCWIWQGKKNMGGYAAMSRQGKDWIGHVWMYTCKYGPVPDGKELDHLCRQRSCINPDHVEPVTSSINKQRGDVTPFTESDILDIVERYKSGESQYRIAKSLGVRQGTISRILLGHRWGNIVSPQETRSPIKLTREQAYAIALLCSFGMQQRIVAKRFGIGQSQTSRIVRGESWR